MMMLASPNRAVNGLTNSLRIPTPAADVTRANTRAVSGESWLAGSGRRRVRRISASRWISRSWFSVLAPAAANPVPKIVQNRRS